MYPRLFFQKSLACSPLGACGQRVLSTRQWGQQMLLDDMALRIIPREASEDSLELVTKVVKKLMGLQPAKKFFNHPVTEKQVPGYLLGALDSLGCPLGQEVRWVPWVTSTRLKQKLGGIAKSVVTFDGCWWMVGRSDQAAHGPVHSDGQATELAVLRRPGGEAGRQANSSQLFHLSRPPST